MEKTREDILCEHLKKVLEVDKTISPECREFMKYIVEDKNRILSMLTVVTELFVVMPTLQVYTNSIVDVARFIARK
jgi:hypothetical protein